MNPSAILLLGAKMKVTVDVVENDTDEIEIVLTSCVKVIINDDEVCVLRNERTYKSDGSWSKTEEVFDPEGITSQLEQHLQNADVVATVPGTATTVRGKVVGVHWDSKGVVLEVEPKED